MKVKIIDRTETVIESVFKDVVTFSFLAFCVWISRNSTWWTFLTGTFFLIGFFCWMSKALEIKTNTFKTKADLLAWANALEWPSKKEG